MQIVFVFIAFFIFGIALLAAALKSVSAFRGKCYLEAILWLGILVILSILTFGALSSLPAQF